MSSEEILKNCDLKMKKTYEVFNQDLASLRTGRANASMLDIIKVEVYGQKMSINQLATVWTPEPRLLTVQVWDQNNVSLIDSSIKKSDLGINPQIDGQLLRIPIPSLNEERRNELKKIMGGLAEKAKVAIRNIRREANDQLKNTGKDSKIVDKIAVGKLNKFISENTLLNQEWVMDPKKKVRDVLKEATNKGKIEVIKFVRFKVGEGI